MALQKNGISQKWRVTTHYTSSFLSYTKRLTSLPTPPHHLLSPSPLKKGKFPFHQSTLFVIIGFLNYYPPPTNSNILDA